MAIKETLKCLQAIIYNSCWIAMRVFGGGGGLRMSFPTVGVYQKIKRTIQILDIPRIL